MSQFWDDEDTVSEYELLEDEMLEQEQTAEDIAQEIADQMEYDEPEIVDATDEQLEYIQEQSVYDLDQKESNVVFNARLRLEQAQLYEMLINHDLFQGVDVSDEAINTVQDELKHFIVKRLELLLGMRKPKPQAVVASEVELPFNEAEVDALKQLAYKLSKGQTAQASAPMRVSSKPSIKPLTGSTGQNRINPIQKTTNKPKPVQQQSKPQTKPQPQPQQKAKSQPESKPQPKKKPAKNNNKPKNRVSARPNQKALTQKQIMELAKADIEAMKDRKPLSKLKGKEKIKAIKEVNERHKRKVANGGQPFPESKQLEMQYMNQSINGRNPNDVLQSMANSILKAQKLK